MCVSKILQISLFCVYAYSTRRVSTAHMDLTIEIVDSVDVTIHAYHIHVESNLE